LNKFYLLAIFLIVKSIYLPLNKRKSKYYWKIALDDKIPFLPLFIVPYFGYFLLIAFTIVSLWNTAYIYRFLITYIISYVLAGIFWYLFPNGVKRPMLANNTILNKVLIHLYKHDNDTNGFPSAHVFATLICWYFLVQIFPAYSLLVGLIGACIIASTVFIKQHYILDILGGIGVFFLSNFITMFLYLIIK
jgi:membrane-associated phospholipid phosphatase